MVDKKTIVPEIKVETVLGEVESVYAVWPDGSDHKINDQEFLDYLNGKIKDSDAPCGSEGSMVDHPKHYNSHPSGIECIEIAEWYDFNVGNAIKYLWRHGLKTEEGKDDYDKAVEDLEKAAWYIENEIRLVRKKQALKQCEENKIH